MRAAVGTVVIAAAALVGAVAAFVYGVAWLLKDVES